MEKLAILIVSFPPLVQSIVSHGTLENLIAILKFGL